MPRISFQHKTWIHSHLYFTWPLVRTYHDGVLPGDLFVFAERTHQHTSRVNTEILRAQIRRVLGTADSSEHHGRAGKPHDYAGFGLILPPLRYCTVSGSWRTASSRTLRSLVAAHPHRFQGRHRSQNVCSSAGMSVYLRQTRSQNQNQNDESS
jgi:hypothetical protein